MAIGEEGQLMAVHMSIDKADMMRIDKALKALPVKCVNRVLGPAASFAMKPALAQAKATAPGRSIRPSLKLKRKTYRNRGVVYVIIGPDWSYTEPRPNKYGNVRPANILHLVEAGAKPHMIGNRHHPGTTATHFIEKALDDNATKIAGSFTSRAVKGSEREAAKLGAAR